MSSICESMCASTSTSNPIHGFYRVEARTKNEENGHVSDVRFYLTKQETDRRQLLPAIINLTDARNHGISWATARLEGSDPEWTIDSGANWRPNLPY